MTKIIEPFDPVAGVQPQIGYYLAGIEYARSQTREGVKDLTNKQIAAKLMPETHAIGQLLIHCAEAQWWWINVVIARTATIEDMEKREFRNILKETDYASRNHSAAFCIKHMNAIDAQSREVLKNVSDDDMETFYPWEYPKGRKIEMTLRGILTHLIDHEATHKGQILMLKRLMSE